MVGKIADREHKEESLKTILITTSIFIISIPLIQKNILDIIVSFIHNIKLGAIISTTFLFFIPSLFMGIVTPIILKLKLENLETAGKTSGRISAIGTIGGITGTFLGGFLLIPNIGSNNILFILTIVIVCLIPLVKSKLKDKALFFVIIMIIISIICLSINSKRSKYIEENIFKGLLDEAVSIDTKYGRALIYNKELNGNNIRILNIDSGHESATYTDKDKIYELVFEYTKYYDLMFDAKIDIKDALLIGGAGYSYPKYYISHYKDKSMDVVEIDDELTEIAKKYFYLDKLIEEYDLNNNKRLNFITEDGRTYLNRNTKKYDAILNDAFSGENPAKTLTTIENIKNVKKSLNTGGVYLTNIISSLDGENSKFVKAEVNTLKQVFKNVYVVPCNFKEDIYTSQNLMVISTDDDLNFENTYNLDIKDNEIIITDDYCPIDTLIPAF